MGLLWFLKRVRMRPRLHQTKSIHHWISRGGPHTYYPDATFMNYMEMNAKYVGTKFWILDSYFIVRAKDIELVLTPAVGCVFVYHQSMQMGLRFPLHSLIKDLLNTYQLTLTNSWLTINGFISVCELLGITPSVRLWRNLFTLMLGPVDLHGPGWFRFQCRLGYKVVRDAPSNQKGFRQTFYHIYTRGEWRILIPPPEAMAGIYLFTTPRAATRDLTYVPSNWLTTRYVE